MTTTSNSVEEDLLPCGGPGNELDGCNGIFEFSACSRTPGLCPRCRKFRDATTEDEKERIKTSRSCTHCGVCGTFVEDPCGACRRKILGVDFTKSSAATNRAEILDRRVHANRPFTGRPFQDATNRIPSGSSTTSIIGPLTPADDLLAMRSAAQSSGTAESKILVQWVIRLADADNGSITKENGAMGKTMRALPESSSTQHLLEYMIKESQIAWKEAKNLWPLDPEFCTVRGHKNITFPENGVDTLLKMYTWQKANNPSAIVNSSARSKGSKTSGHSAMLLELTVFTDKYNRHHGGNGDSDSDEDGESARKRKKRTAGGRASKRGRRERGSTESEPLLPLTSKFVGNGQGNRSQWPSKGHEQPYTEICFRRTEAKVDENEEEARINVVDGSIDEAGWLSDLPMALESRDEGRSKVPYMLKISDTLFVAKEVVNLGTKGKITPQTAKAALVAELKRLELARWVMQNFKVHAQEKGIPLDPFDVTSAFLATVAVSPTHGPHSELDNMDGESTRYFLVEPLRSTTTVKKFSGTLGTRPATDALSGTINAFSHYAAEFLAAKTVFCDIQGSSHKSATETTFILFDPMTHSIQGDSGPGDHGVDGIKTFISSHKCSQHCKRLKLVEKGRLRHSAKTAAEAEGVDWEEEEE